MKVSIIIPNFNGEQILNKNLPSVLSAMREYGDCELIIVDDGSLDDSVLLVERLILENKTFDIKLFKNERNKGFSSAVNTGASIAKGEIFLLLNSDVSPSLDFIKFLASDFIDDQIFAVGCLDKSIEKEKIIERGRGIGKIVRGFLMHGRGDTGKKNTLWAAGGSSAFRKEIWEKLSGMDEIYSPFYWDDIDLSYRALKSGYKVLFEKRSVVEHRHFEGAIRKNFSEGKVKRIAYRNQIIFSWKNFDKINLFSHIFWLPYHFSLAILRLDFNFLAGFFMAILRIPKVIESRSKAFLLFILKDEEVLKDLEK